MSEYMPLETAADYDALNDDECVRGYRDGWDGALEPGSDKSKSYWHGWRNSQIDKGLIPTDYASGQFARVCIARHKAH